MQSDAGLPEWNGFARTNAAQRWRRQSAAMGRHMTQAIVAAAKIQPGMLVLDVACGTGEPSISMADLLRGSGGVVGVDLSPEPLKIAAERAQARGLTNVRFQQADVHQLSFSDRTFDRVTSRLGVMFFSDVPGALRQMHRVLKPDGRVTLLAWGPMQQPYFETTIGTVLGAVPGSTLPGSSAGIFQFGQPGVLANALRQAGFHAIEEDFPILPWTWPGSPQEVWEYFQEVTVPFKPLLRSIPEDRRAEINARVLTAVERYYDGERVNFTAKVCLVSASAGGGSAPL